MNLLEDKKEIELFCKLLDIKKENLQDIIEKNKNRFFRLTGKIYNICQVIKDSFNKDIRQDKYIEPLDKLKTTQDIKEFCQIFGINYDSQITNDEMKDKIHTLKKNY